MTTGEKIKHYCNKLNMSQGELAEKVGVTPVSMSRYINDTRVPKAPILVKIARVLGVAVEELMSDNGDCILEPCPFCRSTHVNVTRGMMTAPFYFFKCNTCGAVVSFDNLEANRKPERAISYWNTRR